MRLATGGAGAGLVTGRHERCATTLFAAACSDLAGVRPAAGFSWSADGLLVGVPGAGTGLVVPPGDGRGDAPGHAGCGLRAAAMGAGAALVAAALTAGPGGDGGPGRRAAGGRSSGGRADPRWVCSVDSVLGPRARSRPGGSEWLGYVPVGRGWIGLVLPGPEAQAIWEAAVAALGVLTMSSLAAAALLQRLGVAAFPARAPGRAPGPDRPDAVRPAAAGPLLRQVGDAAATAIAGRRVVDLGRVVAAPFTARILTDLGAEVRRVRPPGTPGQAGAVIDLRDPAGAEQIAALVSQADLVVENFRPRGWAEIQALTGRAPRRRTAIRGFDAGSALRNWKMYGFLVEGFFGIGARPCGPDGRAEGGAAWDRLCGVVAAAAAIRQLTAGTPAVEISQVGLARSWLEARRAADSSDRDEEQLRL